MIHVVQYPDAAGLLRHGQDKFVLSERKLDQWYPSWNHQARAVEFGHLKRAPNWFSRGGVEVDSPDIEKAAGCG